MWRAVNLQNASPFSQTIDHAAFSRGSHAALQQVVQTEQVAICIQYMVQCFVLHA